jgi:hypothetical protein
MRHLVLPRCGQAIAGHALAGRRDCVARVHLAIAFNLAKILTSDLLARMETHFRHFGGDRMNRRAIFGVCIASAICLCMAIATTGCDSKSTSADSSTTTPPTTRDIRTESRVDMDLRVLPLTLTVPSSWKLDMTAGVVVVLGGRTPAGEAQISLSRLPLETPKDVDLMIADAPHEADRDLSHTTRLQTMTINGLKVFETIVFPKGATTQPTTEASGATTLAAIRSALAEPNPMPTPTTQADAVATSVATSAPTTLPMLTLAPAQPGKPAAALSAADDNSNLISWNIIYYVPQGNDLIPCDLAILGLTPQQFAVDEPFLREILSSAKLNAAPQTP